MKPLRLFTLSLATAISLCGFAAAAADLPLAGAWKLNTEKSHMAGDRFSFTSAPGGAVRYTEGNDSYTFKPDGSPVTTSAGNKAESKKEGTSTLKEHIMKDGRDVADITWKLSDDGTR